MQHHDQTSGAPHETDTHPLSGLSRRHFLASAGAVGAAAVVVTQLSPSLTGPRPASAGVRRGNDNDEPSLETDLDTAEVAAGLEVLAVGTYTAALEAATAGNLGAVPPAVADYVQTAQAQHQAYLDRLNGLLEDNDRSAITEPPEDLKNQVDSQFADVTDVLGAAQLARDLEEISSATYLKAIPTLTPDTAQLAGSILCVGQQRVATLLYVLGEYPVPEVFASTDKAVQ